MTGWKGKGAAKGVLLAYLLALTTEEAFDLEAWHVAAGGDRL
jgi:hypothetical protein